MESRRVVDERVAQTLEKDTCTGRKVLGKNNTDMSLTNL